MLVLKTCTEAEPATPTELPTPIDAAIDNTFSEEAASMVTLPPESALAPAPTKARVSLLTTVTSRPAPTPTPEEPTDSPSAPAPLVMVVVSVAVTDTDWSPLFAMSWLTRAPLPMLA